MEEINIEREDQTELEVQSIILGNWESSQQITL